MSGYKSVGLKVGFQNLGCWVSASGWGFHGVWGLGL